MKSFRADIERLLPHLRQVARALVEGHRADVADDLVHEVLEDALRNERAWAGDELDVRLFGRLIAANRGRVRGAVVERRSVPGGWGGDGRAPGPGAQPARDGLDALPLGDREVLLLVVLGRLDYIRAADALGLPASTVVARLAHARDTLGTALWSGMPVAGRPARPSHLRLVKS